MEERFRRNPIAVSLGLGVVLFIAWIVTREPVALIGALILFVVALLGDRLKKAPLGFEFFRDRVVRQVRTEAPPPAARTASGQAGGTVASSEPIVVRVPAGELKLETLPPTVVIGTLTSDAVVAAAKAMESAATPEELAERVVEYVELRTVPGLRGLSDERIRREKELFGAILELQTLRARGARAGNPGRLQEALDRIGVFWTRPEQLSDEAIVDATALVRAVIDDMDELPIPQSFRDMGMKAHLTGAADPCPVCAPLRERMYDPNDPDSPRPPISGCQHERGCTCRYV